VVPQELSREAGCQSEEDLSAHVRFVRTGNVGPPMATNILEAGHQSTVWDLRREATREIENLGAQRCRPTPPRRSARLPDSVSLAAS